MGRPPPRLRSLPIVLVAFAVLLASRVARQPEQRERPSYSDFLGQVESDQVEHVKLDVDDNSLEVSPRQGDEYETAYPDNTEQSLINTLRAQDVPIDVKAKSGGGISR